MLTPGEVTRLSEDTMLVLSGNRQPMLVTQRRWYQDRRLRRLGRLHSATGAPATTHAHHGHGQVAARATERPAAGEPQEAVAIPAAAATAQPVQAAGDDGAVQLDHNHPAGETTWVPAPEDHAPTEPAPEPPAAATPEAAPVAAGAAAVAFELPKDG